MSNRACIIMLSSAIAAATHASAATLTPLASPQGMIILLRGDIAAEDAMALENLMNTIGSDGRLAQRLALDSSGGSFMGGINLARFIWGRGDITTMVNYGAICTSACFLAFAAGRAKLADYNSFIGVHGVADTQGHVSERTLLATRDMARISEELGVPEDISNKIISTPPGEIAWLNTEDLKSMGVTLVGRPVQAPRGGPRDPSPQGHKVSSSAPDMRSLLANKANPWFNMAAANW